MSQDIIIIISSDDEEPMSPQAPPPPKAKARRKRKIKAEPKPSKPRPPPRPHKKSPKKPRPEKKFLKRTSESPREKAASSGTQPAITTKHGKGKRYKQGATASKRQAMPHSLKVGGRSLTHSKGQAASGKQKWDVPDTITTPESSSDLDPFSSFQHSTHRGSSDNSCHITKRRRKEGDSSQGGDSDQQMSDVSLGSISLAEDEPMMDSSQNESPLSPQCNNSEITPNNDDRSKITEEEPNSNGDTSQFPRQNDRNQSGSCEDSATDDFADRHSMVDTATEKHSSDSGPTAEFTNTDDPPPYEPIQPFVTNTSTCNQGFESSEPLLPIQADVTGSSPLTLKSQPLKGEINPTTFDEPSIEQPKEPCSKQPSHEEHIASIPNHDDVGTATKAAPAPNDKNTTKKRRIALTSTTPLNPKPASAPSTNAVAAATTTNDEHVPEGNRLTPDLNGVDSTHFTTLRSPQSSVTSDSVEPSLVCTACGIAMLGDEMFEHPDLHVMICDACNTVIREADFTVGEDGLHDVCSWCGRAEGVDSCCCDNCPRIFCYSCIVRNLGQDFSSRLEKSEEDWKCFKCDTTPLKYLRKEYLKCKLEEDSEGGNRLALSDDAVEKVLSNLYSLEMQLAETADKLEGSDWDQMKSEIVEELKCREGTDDEEKITAMADDEIALLKAQWGNKYEGLQERIGILSERLSDDVLQGFYRKIDPVLGQVATSKQLKEAPRLKDEGINSMEELSKFYRDGDEILQANRPVKLHRGKVREVGADGYSGPKQWYTAVTPREAEEQKIEGGDIVDEISDLHSVDISELPVYKAAFEEEDNYGLTAKQKRKLRSIPDDFDRKRVSNSRGRSRQVRKTTNGTSTRSGQSVTHAMQFDDCDSDMEMEETQPDDEESQENPVGLLHLSVEDDDPMDDDEPHPITLDGQRRAIRTITAESAVARSAKEHEENLKRQRSQWARTDENIGDGIINPVRPPSEDVVMIHQSIARVLKPHQVIGIRFLWTNLIHTIESVQSGDPGRGAILAHEMGLGKTLQSLAFVHTALTCKQLNFRCALVLVPVNVLSNWREECQKWFPEDRNVNVYCINDVRETNARALMIQGWETKGGVLIMGHTMFRTSVQGKQFKKESDELYNHVMKSLLNPDLVVLDEGHVLQNRKSEFHKALVTLKCQRRIVLTGTPLQNNLKEYYNMVEFVRKGLLGSPSEFSRRFVNPIVNGQFKDSTPQDVALMRNRIFVLNKLLKSFVHRCDSTVLAKSLKPKYEYVISVCLSPLQRSLYKKCMNVYTKRQNKEESFLKLWHTLSRIWNYPQSLSIVARPAATTSTTAATAVAAATAATAVTGAAAATPVTPVTAATTVIAEARRDSDASIGLSKEAKDVVEINLAAIPEEDNSPDLVIADEDWWTEDLSGSPDPLDIDNCGKMQLAMEIIEQATLEGDKVAVFSQFLSVLAAMEKILESRGYHSGDSVSRIDGKTLHSDRQSLCNAFNDPGSRLNILLISMKAGNVGINLVGGNRVIAFDVSWNPAVDQQAIARTYRYGQTKPVYVYRLVAHRTMEQKIYQRQIAKQAMTLRVIDDQQVARLTNTDVQNLLEDGSEDSQDTTGAGETKGSGPNQEAPVKGIQIEYFTAKSPPPKDIILKRLLGSDCFGKWIHRYHLHASTLTRDVGEEKLTEAEGQAAMDEYKTEVETSAKEREAAKATKETTKSEKPTSSTKSTESSTKAPRRGSDAIPMPRLVAMDDLNFSARAQEADRLLSQLQSQLNPFKE